MQEWLEFGHRAGLPYRELARRAGVCPRTVMRWQQRFRKDAALRMTPDLDPMAFVKLAESPAQASPDQARIEFVIPGQRRLVIRDGELIAVLARLLYLSRQC